MSDACPSQAFIDISRAVVELYRAFQKHGLQPPDGVYFQKRLDGTNFALALTVPERCVTVRAKGGLSMVSVAGFEFVWPNGVLYGRQEILRRELQDPE